MKDKFLKSVREIVGPSNVLTKPEDLFCYSYDGSLVWGRKDILPHCVILPGNVSEVAEIVKLAGKAGVKIVPRGAGSNLTGGSLPVEDSVVVQMTRMNKVLEIDMRNMTAILEPGVITGSFQRMVEKKGLFYPPDPASLEFSTIGGNVAECAGGPRGVKYGVTRDYVLSLEVVLADGSILKTGARTMKSVAGYDLTRLFTGSEGTLGLITKITVKLIPKPKENRTLLVSFNDINATAETVVEIMARGIIPSALELFDNIYIVNMESFVPTGLPLEAEAALLIDVDGTGPLLDEQVKEIEEVCRRQGAMQIRTAASEKEREKLWHARRTSYGAVARNYPTIISEDVTVPRDMIPAAVKMIKKIAKKHGTTVAIIGHAGDGNLHACFLTDESKENELAKVKNALPELFQEALNLGGTITGEHGIGLTKSPFLRWEAGEKGMEVMKAIKNALDPCNLFNSGKIFGE